MVKPGDSVDIPGWSSQQLLPGYPLLEARLNTASSRLAYSLFRLVGSSSRIEYWKG